ncbi:Ifi206 [Phodopus roborovskii]|uniref:Ifi206 protein n=1 Tax=Phodopus roborovskii TaxID=109678 RepID=A0AAU9Z9Z3_PHORO|nr:Ifi206 [Phodopus roborovskii]
MNTRKIVLLSGLQSLSDYHFRVVKSLLIHNLQLNKKMQDDYDSVKIADLMEEKSQSDAGLSILIELCQDISELGNLVDTLRKKMEKDFELEPAMKTPSSEQQPGLSGDPSNSAQKCVTLSGDSSNNDQWYKRPQVSVPTVAGSYNTPQISETVSSSNQASQVTPATVPSRNQAFPVTPSMTSGYKSPRVSAATVSGSYSTPQVIPATVPSRFKSPPQSPATQPSNCSSHPLSFAKVRGSFSATSASPPVPLKKPRLKTVPKQPSEEDGYHQGPKQVMVLKATEPFTYDMREDKMMFHASVATETEFFRVKVFDIVLKEKFICNKVIVISDYVGHSGFLEIHRAASVSEVNGSNMMTIPLSLKQRANATPKINTICTQRGGTFVNGVFAVYMKIVKNEFIYYGIEDKTGKMEVVVHGQFTNMHCEPGDKLRLLCFELSSCIDKWQLRSGRHSYLQISDFILFFFKVIQARTRDIEPPNLHSVMDEPYTPI